MKKGSFGVSERPSKKAAAAAKEKSRFVLLRGIAREEFCFVFVLQWSLQYRRVLEVGVSVRCDADAESRLGGRSLRLFASIQFPHARLCMYFVLAVDCLLRLQLLDFRAECFRGFALIVLFSKPPKSILVLFPQPAA